MKRPGQTPRNPIERAANAALDAFTAALPAGYETAHLIVLARVPGLRPDAVIAGATDPNALIDLLLINAKAVGDSIGRPVEVIPYNGFGRG